MRLHINCLPLNVIGQATIVGSQGSQGSQGSRTRLPKVLDHDRPATVPMSTRYSPQSLADIAIVTSSYIRDAQGTARAPSQSPVP
jgi:hypothetical protein